MVLVCLTKTTGFFEGIFQVPHVPTYSNIFQPVPKTCNASQAHFPWASAQRSQFHQRISVWLDDFKVKVNPEVLKSWRHCEASLVSCGGFNKFFKLMLTYVISMASKNMSRYNKEAPAGPDAPADAPRSISSRPRRGWACSVALNDLFFLGQRPEKKDGVENFNYPSSHNHGSGKLP